MPCTAASPRPRPVNFVLIFIAAVWENQTVTPAMIAAIARRRSGGALARPNAAKRISDATSTSPLYCFTCAEYSTRR